MAIEVCRICKKPLKDSDEVIRDTLRSYRSTNLVHKDCYLKSKKKYVIFSLFIGLIFLGVMLFAIIFPILNT